MILNVLLSIMLSAFIPSSEADSLEFTVERSSLDVAPMEIVSDNGYWKRNKYSRISLNKTHFSPLFVDHDFPLTFSAGWDRGRNIYLHKQPIAGILKFGVDIGADLTYMGLDMDRDYSDYEGPYGYTGTEPLESEDDMDMFLQLNGHHITLGVAVGPSVTVNPIDKLRLCGYFHVVPSASFFVQGISMNVGFTPFLKYGLEVSYGFIGLGIEHNSGMGTYLDMVRYLSVKGNEGDVSSIFRPRFFAESLQFYISLRFGRK